MSIALIDYGAGNLHSVHNALVKAGAKNVAVTADPDVVWKADRIVLPGVGSFGHCRDALYGIDGMVDAITASIYSGEIPFLGICVGMQLLADTGEEHGIFNGLGLIPGHVGLIQPTNPEAKVPHMGWNDVTPATPHPLIVPGEAYFLHSYHFAAADPAHVLATTDHGGPIVAAVGRDTIVGVQFHPEKSQHYGLSFLSRFLEWRP